MARGNIVNVVEQSRISPPSGSVSTSTTPLSHFDLIWLSIPPVERIFLYEFPHSKDHFINTILPDIKHSLSLTLRHFFPVAGNLTWLQDSNKPEILYLDGDSVSLTVAETDSDFSRLVNNHARETNEFYPFLPNLVHKNLIAFQVTLFPNKGICLGITYNHAVADGRALHHFIKSWASTCRLKENTGLLPCCDRSIVQDPKGLYLSNLNFLKKYNFTPETFNNSATSQRALNSANKVLATFVLQSSHIGRLKQWILAHVRESQTAPFHLSTFVITCAYVWVCCVKARWGKDFVSETEDPIEYFVFSVDFRARLKPPLPETYFGNCLFAPIIEIKRSELMGEYGLAVAAELIGKTIQNVEDLDMEIKDIWSERDRILTVAGAPKLGIYDNDFGWGKPKKSEVVSIAATGAVSLAECPSEARAVEVGLARNKIEMDAFTKLFTDTMEVFSQIDS